MNPVTTLPVFLAVTEGVSGRRRRRVGVLTGLTVLVVLLLALVAGRSLLDLLGINLAAFRIAGAAVIVALAWSLLTARPSPFVRTADVERQPVYVVPIGFPSLAGPGALSLVIAYSTRADGVSAYAFGALVIGLVALTVAAFLAAGPLVARVLGPTGLDVASRIFGLLLLAIAIGTLLAALGAALPGLVAT